MENKKLITILVLITTVILAGIALFTAVKLYQLGQEPVAPSPSLKAVKPSPSSEEEVPLIAEQEGVGICELAFNVSVSPSPSPSPSASPSLSPSPTPSASPSPSTSPSPLPSASPLPECWDVCTSDSQCPSTLVCLEVSGVYRCVNPDCPTESDCLCPAEGSPSPSPSPGESPAPSPSELAAASPAPAVPTQQLPEAGIISPTLIFSLGGIVLLLLGLLL